MARVWALDLAELPPGKTALVTVDGMDVALFRRGGEVFAIGNACPHQGGSLCDGRSRATSSSARSTAGSSTCARAPA